MSRRQVPSVLVRARHAGGVRMRTAALVAAAAAAVALTPGAASASVLHTVAPGETLSGIATADGLPTAAVAAANGLPADAAVLSGTTLQIPASETSASSTATATTTAASTSSAPPVAGAYTVRPGDTLSGLAANAGTSPSSLAALNGLDQGAILLAGTVVHLPSGSAAPARSGEPAPPPTYPSAASPHPTSGTVTSAQISDVATRNGVPASLASAIGWQESGFNNAAVSMANARGVMQVLPGTWNWVQATLAKRTLDPSSAQDNVGAGVLYLGSLLRSTANERTAVAAYYQGLASVRSHGMLPETQRYVDNVEALKSRFGG